MFQKAKLEADLKENEDKHAKELKQVTLAVHWLFVNVYPINFCIGRL